MVGVDSMNGATLKLLFVRIYPQEQRMEVGFYDTILEGKRLVQYVWHTKDATPLPPVKWYKSVVGEVQFQRGQELQKKSGRFIPRG